MNTPMDGWMDQWMNGIIHGWMIDELMMVGPIDRPMDRMDGWMDDGRMNQWMDRCVD